MTVVGAAATAEDSQAELLVNLPRSGGEVLGVIAIWVVSRTSFSVLRADALALNSTRRRATRFENICPFRKALAAMEG